MLLLAISRVCDYEYTHYGRLLGHSGDIPALRLIGVSRYQLLVVLYVVLAQCARHRPDICVYTVVLIDYKARIHPAPSYYTPVLV